MKNPKPTKQEEPTTPPSTGPGSKLAPGRLKELADQVAQEMVDSLNKASRAKKPHETFSPPIRHPEGGKGNLAAKPPIPQEGNDE